MSKLIGVANLSDLLWPGLLPLDINWPPIPKKVLLPDGSVFPPEDKK